MKKNKCSKWAIALFCVAGIALANSLSSCGGMSRLETEIDTPYQWLQKEPTGKKALMLVVDTSDSMTGEKMINAKVALDKYIRSLSSDVEIGMVTFPRFEVVEPRAKRDCLIKRIRELETGDDTPLAEAVYLAYKELAGVRADEYHMAIITDGEANNKGILRRNVDFIIKNSPIRITTIGININSGHSLNREGVRYIEVNDFDSLKEGLGQILLEAPIE